MGERPLAAATPGLAALTAAPGPAIVIGSKRRPEEATQVRLADWEGPIGLLLALVEAHRMDVRSVPLGALAEAYLDALAGVVGDRLGNISAFVAIASQLILIKSRAMLPRPPAAPTGLPDDEPDPEAELRARLVLYRVYRDAGAVLQARALDGALLARREPSVATATARTHAVAPEPPRLDVAILTRALRKMVAIVPLPPTPPEVVSRTITLAERARFIRAALAEAGPIVLQDLLAGVRDRVVVVVTFLAMLELVKRREVTIEQAAPWGPIIVTSVPKPADPAADPTADGGTGEPAGGKSGSTGSAHLDVFDEHLEEYA